MFVFSKVLYNPRKTMGIGLTDGESIERLWSYLGGFSKITREGQSIAIRLNRQLTQETKELEKKIREYNTLSKGQKVSMADVSELCDVDDSKNVASEAEKIKS
uniref:Uncharacterized protein n=1 Tax=Magallana gigas TaxID=29159 RepID=K1RE56_MAGGI